MSFSWVHFRVTINALPFTVMVTQGSQLGTIFTGRSSLGKRDFEESQLDIFATGGAFFAIGPTRIKPLLNTVFVESVSAISSKNITSKSIVAYSTQFLQKKWYNKKVFIFYNKLDEIQQM